MQGFREKLSSNKTDLTDLLTFLNVKIGCFFFFFTNSWICRLTHVGAHVNITIVCVCVCGERFQRRAETCRVSKQKAERRESWEIFCKKEIEGSVTIGGGRDKNSRKGGGWERKMRSGLKGFTGFSTHMHMQPGHRCCRGGPFEVAIRVCVCVPVPKSHRPLTLSFTPPPPHLPPPPHAWLLQNSPGTTAIAFLSAWPASLPQHRTWLRLWAPVTTSVTWYLNKRSVVAAKLNADPSIWLFSLRQSVIIISPLYLHAVECLSRY